MGAANRQQAGSIEIRTCARDSIMSNSLIGTLAGWFSGAFARPPRSDLRTDGHVQGIQFAAGWQPNRPRRLHQAVRFALPQKHAIAVIVTLTLTIAALNALKPLVIKMVFDELTAQRVRILALSIAALGGLALLREVLEGVANWLTWRARIGLQ
jgi:hypothetical protein